MTINADSGLKRAQRKIAADTTQTLTDGVIGVDTTLGAVKVTLLNPAAATPTPSLKEGHELVVQDRGGSAGVLGKEITIEATAPSTVNGAASVTISSNFGSRILSTDGTNWFVIASA